MSAKSQAEEIASYAEHPLVECAKGMGILNNKNFPTELRNQVIRDDFIEHITSSINTPRSPLHLALKELVEAGLPQKVHHEMYAEILALWEKKNETTFRVLGSASLQILDNYSRPDRLSIRHLVFDRWPLDEQSEYGFPPTMRGQKITVSNSLRSIHYCIPSSDLVCHELFRSYDIGGRFSTLIPAAIKTLEKVVIELPIACKYESCPDDLLTHMRLHLQRIGWYLGTAHKLEQAPSGALFLVWSAPFIMPFN
ncbi:hypothetical protein ONS95_012152 [Cadophora gregata]|uniref:uncharacterized protein n=1 Tax=Cadophora gregata TaxID=51156 RepID=UPI0026DB1A6A|nr:uncharacterized protein ONS95_012152 [Cadophora gregata]KAK0117828.1 hypothetical protein ONS95_012152 [Cadophora gregata]